MNPHERMEAAAEKFAGSVATAIATQVERAVALERDRLDSDILGLTHELHRLRVELETNRSAIAGLRLFVSEQMNAHSMRREP